VNKNLVFEKMGFEKEILREGNGKYPQAGRSVTVHCTGYGKNGDMSQKFWSTKDPGQEPFTFTIGRQQVIKGWDEGVMTMVSYLYHHHYEKHSLNYFIIVISAIR
jgi:FKBP-type peptidyl-prolyl cis-trans isomerase